MDRDLNRLMDSRLSDADLIEIRTIMKKLANGRVCAADLEDLLSKVFRELLRKLGERSWVDNKGLLVKITRDRIKDLQRERTQGPQLVGLGQISEAPAQDVERLIQARAILADLPRLCGKLKPVQHAVIWTFDPTGAIPAPLQRDINVGEWRLHRKDVDRPGDRSRMAIWGSHPAKPIAPEYTHHCLPELRRLFTEEWGS